VSATLAPSEALLPPSFFRREALALARDLLGRWLRHGEVVLEITEVEAYRGPTDTACHAAKGRTPRNAALWSGPGRLYVYTCYGLHQMTNIVSGPDDGVGAAVLVRACAPVAGLDLVRARRGDRDGPVLLDGPGKVGAALGIDGRFNHHPLYEPGGVELLHGTPAERVLVGRRIGIDYASPAHRDAPWRVATAGTPWVSHRRGLSPEGSP
jgi:DNA-3-methyladenine glycosylase